MALMKNPLRHDLPIPWQQIKELGDLRTVRCSERYVVATVPVTKRKLQLVEPARSEGIKETKRRKVAEQKREHVESHDTNAMDHEEEFGAKMDFEVCV